jgi:hypothetical protein
MIPVILVFSLLAQATNVVPSVKSSASPQAGHQNTESQTVARSAAIALTVAYRDGNLTVIAPEASLNEVLRTIRQKANVQIVGRLDGDERVSVKIGPAPVRDVLVALLEGSHYSFVIVSDDASPQITKKIVLFPRLPPGAPEPSKSGRDNGDVPIGTIIFLDPERDEDPDKPPQPLTEPSARSPEQMQGAKKPPTMPTTPPPVAPMQPGQKEPQVPIPPK